jgi:cytochrome c oxidase assembly factor CtaG
MSHSGVAADEITQPLTEVWTLDPWIMAPLALAAGVYLRGWWRLHAQAPRRYGAERLAAFLGGLTAIAVALGSPLHALGSQLLQAHMVQHLLLMMVAPPLLWLGAPLLPLLQGLPRSSLRLWVGPLSAWPALTRMGQWVTHLPVAWVVYVGSAWAWHTPLLYERALTSEFWHYAQHTCFFATALAFWWPVVRPWPSRPMVPSWAMVLYLILADLQNTVLSAWLVFAERLIYPSYATASRLWGISALDDQAAAGAIMWVPGSVAFLLPLAWIVGQILSPKGPHAIGLDYQRMASSRVRFRGSDNGEER